MKELVEGLKGPIVVTGAGGFIGANMMRELTKYRSDVKGVVKRSNWRTKELSKPGSYGELNSDLYFCLKTAGTVFNFAAHGAYPDQTNVQFIFDTNVRMLADIMEFLLNYNPEATFVNAGTSSEYGYNCNRPHESSRLYPDSLYAVSKVAASYLMEYYATKGMNCHTLRLYSTYGPFEDPSRLIPQLIIKGLQGEFPPLADPDLSRDFIYVKDVIKAFLTLAGKECGYGRGSAYNIGTGTSLTLGNVFKHVRVVMGIKAEPVVTGNMRPWEHSMRWSCNNYKAKEAFGWTPDTAFADGFLETMAWYLALENPREYREARHLAS